MFRRIKSRHNHIFCSPLTKRVQDAHDAGIADIARKPTASSYASQVLLPWHEIPRFDPAALRRSPHLPRLRALTDKSYDRLVSNTAAKLWLIQYCRSLTSLRFGGIGSSLITTRSTVVPLGRHTHETIWRDSFTGLRSGKRSIGPWMGCRSR